MSLELIQRVRKQIKDGELKLVASSLAFSTVLSIIPFMAVCLALLQKLGGMETTFVKVEKWILSNFSDTAGQEGIHLMRVAIERMMSGKLGIWGAIFLIITSTRLIADMEIGINRVWNVKNSRSFVQRLSFYWVLILIIPFGLATSVAANSVSVLLGPDLVQFIMLTVVLFIIYKILPALFVPWHSAFAGALAGAIITYSVHKGFLYATHKIFNYGKLYGSIAAIPLFLLWVLVIWYGVLMGAIISAAIEHEYGGRVS